MQSIKAGMKQEVDGVEGTQANGWREAGILEFFKHMCDPRGIRGPQSQLEVNRVSGRGRVVRLAQAGYSRSVHKS